MDLIFLLSGEELYRQALIFKQTQDYDKYIIYITMAANYNYQLAMDNIYKCETYEKQNYAVTKYFYIKTTYNNKIQNAYSTHFLAYMYENGLGVKRNVTKAIELYKISIGKGCYCSSYNLAYLYEYGIGCKIDYNKAIELYESAIIKEIDGALNNLAHLYFTRTDGNINYTKAKHLFKLGVEKGCSMALSNLGYFYDYGCAGNVNHIKAIYYYEKAIINGNLTNLNRLISLYKKYIYHIDHGKIIKIYNIGVSANNLDSMAALTQLLKIKRLESEISLT